MFDKNNSTNERTDLLYVGLKKAVSPQLCFHCGAGPGAAGPLCLTSVEPEPPS